MTFKKFVLRCSEWKCVVECLREDTLPPGSQSAPHIFQRNNAEMEPVQGRRRTALLPIAPTRWKIHDEDLMPLQQRPCLP